MLCALNTTAVSGIVLQLSGLLCSVHFCALLIKNAATRVLVLNATEKFCNFQDFGALRTHKLMQLPGVLCSVHLNMLQVSGFLCPVLLKMRQFSGFLCSVYLEVLQFPGFSVLSSLTSAAISKI